MNATTTSPVLHDDSVERLDALAGLSGRLLDLARDRGATQAEVSCSEEAGL
ncbi:MAG TPA: metalloprotease PmbA, partial [Lysobacter sp.]